mgnify:CR=1 FL=1
MWNLVSIEATNLCAFEHFQYAPLQNQATLIFGNNMDNDSQNSNGAGKSALIEAIAIAITGEPLRKVNMDEIINDSHDTAEIKAVLAVAGEGITMTISRKLSRKNPQEIKVIMNFEGEEEEIKQAGVNDYNKYVLDQIGLSKDDIFANFILTARKYRSFLSSSDSTKKEIINRFSNGIIVDESIEALHNDMEPIQKNLLDAERVVSECKGRVSALATEIERTIEESASRSENKKARIENWQSSIAAMRAKIRENDQRLDCLDEKLDALESLDADIQKLEKSKKDIDSAFIAIQSGFKAVGIEFSYDYKSQFDRLSKELEAIKENLGTINKEKNRLSKELEKYQQLLDALKAEFNVKIDNINSREVEIEIKLKKLAETIAAIRQEEKELNNKRSVVLAEVAQLEAQLAGIIQCPKCKHEFMLDKNMDVDQVRQEFYVKTNEANNLLKLQASNKQKYDETVDAGNQAREAETKLSQERTKLTQELNKCETDVLNIRTDLMRVESRFTHASNTMSSLQENISSQRTKMFDAAFNAIDEQITACEKAIKSLELDNVNCDGAIKSYEESIAEIENASETDVIAKLKESKGKYEKELQEAIQAQETVSQQLNALKVQEATFVEFKTHLANTKINAISQITNDFLETIGSDIRVVLSGYTILKSGKVRDKISVSLLRDGVDCGSFEKFSKGEQTRVELANILALHKLTNVNCEELKGLNLLIFDEILDATDEQGLTNVFKALNDTQITSLVVSHGNIAENYPNRLIVNKRDGVSFL